MSEYECLGIRSGNKMIFLPCTRDVCLLLGKDAWMYILLLLLGRLRGLVVYRLTQFQLLSLSASMLRLVESLLPYMSGVESI
jgi:hypothetical protein